MPHFFNAILWLDLVYFLSFGRDMQVIPIFGSLLMLASCKIQPHAEALSSPKSGLAKNPAILKEFTIPLDDISGIALRRGVDGVALELIAVSDKSFSLAIAAVSTSISDMQFGLQDLTGSGLDFFRGHERSNWEAVLSDGTGNVFFLEEDPGAVYVLNRELSASLNRIRLRIPDDHSLRGPWRRDSNSLGEGFVLLKSGHILVVKEKDPTVFIEFGPRGASPRGLLAANGVPALVGLDDIFPLPADKEVDFFPLKVWGLNEFPSDGDLSEIAIAPDDSLLLLSDEGRSVYKVQDLRQFQQDQDRVEVSEVSRLPKGLSKPEGLVVTPRWQMLIAVDNHPQKKPSKREPNLFLLESR